LFFPGIGASGFVRGAVKVIAAPALRFAATTAGSPAIHHTGGDSFAVREWLAADADGRDVHDQSLGQGIACDPSGCIGELADGGLVAYVLRPEAFEEDCTRTALVVAARGDPPADCKAMTIDGRCGGDAARWC